MGFKPTASNAAGAGLNSVLLNFEDAAQGAICWSPLTPRTQLALAAHIRSPGNWLACFTQPAN